MDLSGFWRAASEQKGLLWTLVGFGLLRVIGWLVKRRLAPSWTWWGVLCVLIILISAGAWTAEHKDNEEAARSLANRDSTVAQQGRELVSLRGTKDSLQVQINGLL